VWAAWNILLIGVGVAAVVYGYDYGYDQPVGGTSIAFGVVLICWRVTRALRSVR
jgi:hypothetical protein